MPRHAPGRPRVKAVLGEQEPQSFRVESKHVVRGEGRCQVEDCIVPPQSIRKVANDRQQVWLAWRVDVDDGTWTSQIRQRPGASNLDRERAR